MKHRHKGCNYLSDLLKLEGKSVSAPTIQTILDKHGMASRFERLLKLEEQHLQAGVELTAEQIQGIEKANPAFRERHVERACPGELLSADTFLVGDFKGIGTVYLHEELFVERLRTTFDETVEALQTNLDSWLRHYNTEHPHQGYRNMGRRPIDTIQLYLKSVTKEG